LKEKPEKKEIKKCDRIRVKYLLNDSKKSCDYVLNSYQNKIYPISEYLLHNRDTCYIPKVCGFIQKIMIEKGMILLVLIL
jgi:hypothetical protein